jgi:hypothetical protein
LLRTKVKRERFLVRFKSIELKANRLFVQNMTVREGESERERERERGSKGESEMSTYSKRHGTVEIKLIAMRFEDTSPMRDPNKLLFEFQVKERQKERVSEREDEAIDEEKQFVWSDVCRDNKFRST